MAATKSYEEREELIEKIGEEHFKTGSSARELAPKYKITNVTASRYIALYKTKHGINNDDTKINRQKRALSSIELYLKGYTNSDIAKIFDVSESTINRDINNELSDIDKETANLIKEKLEEARINNLKNQGPKKR